MCKSHRKKKLEFFFLVAPKHTDDDCRPSHYHSCHSTALHNCSRPLQVIHVTTNTTSFAATAPAIARSSKLAVSPNPHAPCILHYLIATTFLQVSMRLLHIFTRHCGRRCPLLTQTTDSV